MAYHKKDNTEKQEKFYTERLEREPHLNGGETPLIPTQEILDQMKGLTREQIVIMANITYNLWETQNHHIWFPYTARQKHIQDMIDLIEGYSSDDWPFEYNTLPREFTGMGIDKSFK